MQILYLKYNKYSYILEEKDLHASGRNPQTNLVEIVEIKKHPYFIACQFHPEFLSRPCLDKGWKIAYAY